MVARGDESRCDPRHHGVALRPGVCVVGPFRGGRQGVVITQGEVLAGRLRAKGYPVVEASHRANRYVRLADVAATLVRQRHRIDVVVLQVFGGPSFVIEDMASGLARKLGMGLVMHLRGGALPDFFDRFPRWSRRVLERADQILAPSPFLCDALSKVGLRGRVVPNIIDLDQYQFRLRETLRPRLLWMRTFHPIYNPVMAIRVLARVRERHPDATLVMAGEEKGQSAAVRAEAVRLGVAPAVRMAGFLALEAKRHVAAESDIFLNTNDIDNTPVSVIEAGAFGLPIVATAVGGVPRLLTHEVSGLLVPAGDDAAMAEAVFRLLADSALAARLSTAGRRLAERSSWDAVAVEWDELLARWHDASSGAQE